MSINHRLRKYGTNVLGLTAAVATGFALGMGSLYFENPDKFYYVMHLLNRLPHDLKMQFIEMFLFNFYSKRQQLQQTHRAAHAA